MNSIRVLIADDHAVFREGLHLLINGFKDIEVVAEAADGIEALEKARATKPDVILMDIAMPRMNGLDATKVIHDALGDVKVIILSMHEKEEYVHQAFKFGATGYILKGSPSQEVAKAIKAVHEGNYFLTSRMQEGVIKAYIESREDHKVHSSFDLLSSREQQVFRLVVEGNSTQRISELLCISPKTVESHRTKIGKKLGVNTPIDMVKYAIRSGVIKPDFWES